MMDLLRGMREEEEKMFVRFWIWVVGWLVRLFFEMGELRKEGEDVGGLDLGIFVNLLGWDGY